VTPAAPISTTVREAILRGDGRLAGAEVIDAHAHIGPWFNFRIPHPYADGMLRTMDHAGVHVAWITADASIGPDFRLGNALVAEAVTAHPDRFRGYVTVNPHYPEESLDDLARRYDAGWRLVKFHTGTHDHPADGPGYRRIWEFAQERGLHLLSHSFPTPERLNTLAAEYPDVSILVGHAASNAALAPAYCAVCHERPNVFLDLCGSTLWRGLLERMVALAGADRVLFGSDIPFVDPRGQLGRVAFARLPDEDLRAVFGWNARRIWERLAAR
jgi:predicted TIM-barrel fold metal-dependent hydrolase